MLLITSNKTDLATDFLILRLHDRGVPFIRINTEDYLSKWEVDLFLSPDKCEANIKYSDGSHIPIKKITGAYIRQPKLPNLQITESGREFSEREVGETLRSLWRFISNNIWLNAPHNILRASNKPEQLSIARNIGFLIPRTCITADIKIIQNFYFENDKKIIAKAVKHGFLYNGTVAKVAATQLINDDVLSDWSNYSRLPMIFQEHIEKQFDIRVTVVGNNVFSTAIHSQDYEETALDWRLSDHHKISLKHRAINLPTHIEDLCRVITKKFNLKYSAIDLILAKNKEYYFLELNPNGQWAWIEQIAGHPIRDAIIDELIYDSKDNHYEVNKRN